MKNKDLKMIAGEFCASFLLAAFGFGTLVSMTCFKTVSGSAEFGFSFGFIIMAVICIFNDVSYAHFNPSVTIGMAVWGKFPKKLVLPYVIAQIVGWGSGAAFLYLIFGNVISDYELAQGIVRGSAESLETALIFFCETSYPVGAAIGEFFITFMLLLITCAVTDDRNPTKPPKGVFPIVIGLFICFCAMWAGGLSSCCLNFARDFGPRVVAWLLGWGSVAFPNHWLIYLIFPALGGIVGVGFYEKVITKVYMQPSLHSTNN